MSIFNQATKSLLLEVAEPHSETLKPLLVGVEFFEKDSQGIDSEALPQFKAVRLAVKCIERLRVHALAYYVALDVFDKKRQNSGCKIDQDGLDYVSKLLEWAVQFDVAIRSSPLNVFDVAPPQYTGSKFVDSLKDYAQVADKLAKYAFASTAFHELAHVYLGHVGTPTLADELEADAEAAKWVLGGGDGEYDHLMRHIGLATKFLWMMSVLINEKDEGESHPFIWDRLLNAMSPTIENEVDPIWGFIVIVLVVHFDRFDLPKPDDVSPSRSSVEAMLETLRQHNERLGVQ